MCCVQSALVYREMCCMLSIVVINDHFDQLILPSHCSCWRSTTTGRRPTRCLPRVPTHHPSPTSQLQVPAADRGPVPHRATSTSSSSAAPSNGTASHDPHWQRLQATRWTLGADTQRSCARTRRYDAHDAQRPIYTYSAVCACMGSLPIVSRSDRCDATISRPVRRQLDRHRCYEY